MQKVLRSENLTNAFTPPYQKHPNLTFSNGYPSSYPVAEWLLNGDKKYQVPNLADMKASKFSF